MQEAWSFLCNAELMLSFFYALRKYFASFLAKQFANKLKHDIIHTRRVLGFTLQFGARLFCAYEENWGCVYTIVSAQAQISHGAQKCHA